MNSSKTLSPYKKPH